jgi:bacterioferritin-associated ferredoxin
MSVQDISDEMGLGTGCGNCLEYACHMAEKEMPVIAREPAVA